MRFKRLKEDIDSFMARDPAARSRLEVVLCYPGFHAILLYRVAHALWRRRFRLVARIVSQIARLLTGIEIHPGARIGARLVIDHGFGVVIGETSEIGDDVTLYQGVTLGGIAPSVDSHAQVDVKRHPTLRNGVIVGAGAHVLGPIIIGEGARIGANAVVSRDLPKGVTAVGIPAHPVMPRDRIAAQRFVAYGTPAEGCPDPVLATIESMRAQVTALQGRIGELEARLRRHEDTTDERAGEFVRRTADDAPVAAVGDRIRR
ncbi:MAG: serine O-acetyltransferase [Rhodospirillales bacterium]|nr:MAG: serine O-acetyltransferase [Rhodospirillales bacterium]